MTTRTNWTRPQLLVAFSLYCRIPFGRISSRNPEIVHTAELIGRSPASLSMKMGNIASLDPAITSTGRAGLGNASRSDQAMWEEMNADWERFGNEAQKALQGLQMVDQSAVSEAIPEIEDSQREGIDRPVETTARVGQSFFRTAVLSAYDRKVLHYRAVHSPAVSGEPYSSLGATTPPTGLIRGTGYCSLYSTTERLTQGY